MSACCLEGVSKGLRRGLEGVSKEIRGEPLFTTANLLSQRREATLNPPPLIRRLSLALLHCTRFRLVGWGGRIPTVPASCLVRRQMRAAVKAQPGRQGFVVSARQRKSPRALRT